MLPASSLTVKPRHALLVCRTSHVLIVQHDQIFLRPFQGIELAHIVQLLDREPQVPTPRPPNSTSTHSALCLAKSSFHYLKVRCIGLMGTMDRDYERRFYHFPQYKLFMEDWDRVILDYVRRLPDGPLRWAALKQSKEEGRSKLLLYTELRFGVPMMPIDFWYDKPHITTTRVYLDFIFGQTHFNYESGLSVNSATAHRFIYIILSLVIYQVAVSNFVEDRCAIICGVPHLFASSHSICATTLTTITLTIIISVGHVVKSACRRHGHLVISLFHLIAH
jgi:hypothetical protein